MIQTDVLVVGGGPGGVAAAIELARAGRDVVLLDKARFPRDKCCGDGLTTGALRLLEHLGLVPASVPRWQVVDEAWVRSPSGPRRSASPSRTGMGQFAAVVPRRVSSTPRWSTGARADGVKVHDGHAFMAVSPSTGRSHRGRGRRGSVRWPAATWSRPTACGRPCARRSALATPGYLGEWHAFRQYFDGVTGSAADRLWVWFEPDLLPGYAWSFPLPGGRANVGFGVRRDGDAARPGHEGAVARAARPAPHRRRPRTARPTAAAPHKAWPIPARIDRAVLATGRVLFVGDAAGACDPLTGEGIGQALLTGTLAARAILEAGALQPDDWPRRATAAPWLEEWLPDHRMAAAPVAGPAPSTASPGAAIRLAGSQRLDQRAASAAGCSRTSPAPPPSPPAAGTASSWPATGAYAADRADP